MSDECNHEYKLMDEPDIISKYGDSNLYCTHVDAVFYCEKCLDIQQVNREVDNYA